MGFRDMCPALPRGTSTPLWSLPIPDTLCSLERPQILASTHYGRGAARVGGLAATAAAAREAAVTGEPLRSVDALTPSHRSCSMVRIRNPYVSRTRPQPVRSRSEAEPEALRRRAHTHRPAHAPRAREGLRSTAQPANKHISAVRPTKQCSPPPLHNHHTSSWSPSESARVPLTPSAEGLRRAPGPCHRCLCVPDTYHPHAAHAPTRARRARARARRASCVKPQKCQN